MNHHLQRALEAIDATAGGLTPVQMLWHPDGKWSAAEILEHLAVAYSGTTNGLERCLEATSSVPPQSLRQRIGTLVVVYLGHFPAGIQAPAFTRPRGMPPGDALRVARENLLTMDRTLDESVERFGRRTKLLKHPILGAFSCAEWRKFHWVHTRHHMKQIARLRRFHGDSGISASRLAT